MIPTFDGFDSNDIKDGKFICKNRNTGAVAEFSKETIRKFFM
jgi:hypothetical protein